MWFARTTKTGHDKIFHRADILFVQAWWEGGSKKRLSIGNCPPPPIFLSHESYLQEVTYDTSFNDRFYRINAF